MRLPWLIERDPDDVVVDGGRTLDDWLACLEDGVFAIAWEDMREWAFQNLREAHPVESLIPWR